MHAAATAQGGGDRTGGTAGLHSTAVIALPLATAALVVYGLSTSTGTVTFSSLVQSRVPEDLRGRAFAGFDVLWQTGRMISLLGGGLPADAVGIQTVYLLGGLLLLAAAGAGVLGSRSATRSPRRPHLPARRPRRTPPEQSAMARAPGTRHSRIRQGTSPPGKERWRAGWG